MGTRTLRKVLIVGGGIAGPVLGLWLRRLNLEVVIAEARPGPAVADGAFLGVAPNGMNVLDAIGVAASVADRGFACAAFTFSNRSGARIGDIDRSADQARFGWPLTMIRRSDLHVTLAEEAARRGVDMRFGKRLVDLDRSNPATVAGRFEDGTEVEADIAVGCDGLHSRVRRIILPDAPAPAPMGMLDCGGFARGPAIPVPAGYNEMVFGRRAFFGAFPTSSGEIWWFHNGPVAEGPLDSAALRARILELHAGDPSWIGDVVRATPHLLGPWSLHEIVAMPRWSEGRVCLLGDAAHTMSPSAGQGASMAMEDAMVLARCLRDIDDPVVAFADFERRRRPRVEAIAAFARRSGSGKVIEGRLSEWLRDRMMPFFLRLGASTQTKSYGYRLEWD